MADQRFPEFIIIGAVKAATTWVAYQLRQHPGIFMPGPEPHYFSSEYHRGRDWYARLFKAAAPGQMIGEKSADYLAHPEAAARMADLLPSIPLIVQLRNPVERAYSDYCMLFRRGHVGKDPARYLTRRNRVLPRFLEDGLYARHLARFADRFGWDRLKIILHDDIRDDPERVIKDVCAHIGIAPLIVPPAVSARLNDSQSLYLPLTMRRLLGPVKGLVKPMRGKPWFEAARGMMARPIRYPPFTPELREQLSDYYAEDVRELENMIGRDLGHWLARPDARGHVAPEAACA